MTLAEWLVPWANERVHTLRRYPGLLRVVRAACVEIGDIELSGLRRRTLQRWVNDSNTAVESENRSAVLRSALSRAADQKLISPRILSRLRPDEERENALKYEDWRLRGCVFQCSPRELGLCR